jgi:hypothetical protein
MWERWSREGCGRSGRSYLPPLTRVALVLPVRAIESRPQVSTKRSLPAEDKKQKDSYAGSTCEPVLDLPCALHVTWRCCLPSASKAQYLGVLRCTASDRRGAHVSQ